MNTEHLIYVSKLIRKNISGEITVEEKKILDEWINESPQNKRLFQKYSKPHFLLSFNKEKDLVESTEAYNSFKRKVTPVFSLQNIFFNRYVSAAVFVAVVCSVSFFFFWVADLNVNTSTIGQTLDKQVTSIDSLDDADIVLTTADGQKIAMGNSQQMMKVSAQSILMGKQSILNVNNNLVAQDVISYNTLKVVRGKRFKMQLSDGSVVWLNADSEITFPNKFVGDRKVKAKGELFFEVTKDASHPFVVETTRGSIQVLGTAFNLRCYQDEMPVTTLVRGKVAYSFNNHSVILKPGQQCRVENDGLRVYNVDTYEYISWIDEVLVFKNKRLDEIMNTLSRLYDVNISYNDEHLKNLSFTGSFKQYENLEDVIQMIEECGLIHIDKNGSQLTIRK